MRLTKPNSRTWLGSHPHQDGREPRTRWKQKWWADGVAPWSADVVQHPCQGQAGEHLHQGSPGFGVLSVASEQVLGAAAVDFSGCQACQIRSASQRLRARECPMLQRYGRGRNYVLA